MYAYIFGLQLNTLDLVQAYKYQIFVESTFVDEFFVPSVQLCFNITQGAFQAIQARCVDNKISGRGNGAMKTVFLPKESVEIIASAVQLILILRIAQVQEEEEEAKKIDPQWWKWTL